MENKGPFTVKELRAMSPGQQIFGKYLLLDKLHRKTKDGKDMYNIQAGGCLRRYRRRSMGELSDSRGFRGGSGAWPCWGI